MNDLAENRPGSSGLTHTAAGEMSRADAFLRRLLSFVVLWTIVVGAVFSGSWLVSNYLFVLIIVLLGVSGLLEFYGLVERRGLACFKCVGVVGGIVLMLGTFLHCTGKLGIHDSPSRVNDFQAALLVCVVLGLCIRQLTAGPTQNGLTAISTTLFGLIYVPWLLNFIQAINYFPTIGGKGRFYLLYFLVVTKLSDTGAYLVGLLMGRHKLCPRISPAKTWEGFFGAVIVAALASMCFAQVAGNKLPGMTPSHALGLGVLLGAGAVVGDLIESVFKREAGVKDSGRLLPGIGGVLDLLDSVLFNAPIMYLYLRHVLTHP